MRLDKLPFAVFNTINKHRLIKPREAIIVAVSGGPDSVALLEILHAINVTKNLQVNLFIAHLNHQLRGKFSEEDAQFVQNVSKDLSLPYILKSVNIQEVAQQTKCSIEETARRERYKFFMESAQRHHATVVATGHTADDNIETTLHRIIRGTGTLGLGGIPIKRPLAIDSTIQLVRPLLFTWRKEILQYLGEKHFPYRTDASNYEPVYLRNKIRLELLPLLENKYNPHIKHSLIQLSQILNIGNEYFISEAKKILQDIVIEGTEDSYTMETRFLTKQPKILQHFVLKEIFHMMRIPLKEITYEHYTKIFDELLRAGKRRYFQLPGKLYLWHEHGLLHFTKTLHYKPCKPLPEITIQIPGITAIYPLGQLVSETIDMQDFSLEAYKKTKTKHEEAFDLHTITMPISIRERKDGDRISPLGIHGHKKLKDLFIDKKIPIYERNTIPIVVMNNQPIWVIGVCMDNAVKVTPDTKKVLKLTFQSIP